MFSGDFSSDSQLAIHRDETFISFYCKILVLKIGYFDFITVRELMLMVALIQGIAMNLPGIMVR